MSMRIVSLSLVFLSLSVARAQEGEKGGQQQEQQRVPTTLAEAHVELERILSAEALAEIDALPSEDDMIQYHMGLGLSIRNGWGLWQRSPLAKHMEELGFTHPDNMSGVILETFWCKRHGQDFRLEERAAEYREYWEAAQKAQEEENHEAAMRNQYLLLMGILAAVLLLGGLAYLAIAKIHYRGRKSGSDSASAAGPEAMPGSTRSPMS